MSGFSFSHLSGPQVLEGYSKAKVSYRASDALLLAYLGEIDARKLFLDAGYPSMHAFCVGEFDVTDDMALNRIRAARVARAFPTILSMLADGRLYFSAVLTLAAHLTQENAESLLAAAANKNKAEVQRMLVARYPRTEMISWTMGTTGPPAQPRPDTQPEQNHDMVVVPERPGPMSSPPEAESQSIPTRVTPIASRASGVQFMMEEEAQDDYDYLRAVLGHEAPTPAKLFALALKVLRREVDKRKFARTNCPQQPRGQASADPRRIPANVRRAVWQRDQHQCTFVSESGKRCDARSGLELDHIVPVAKGGESTVENLRALCRAHNQHAADRLLGPEFMNGKREAARKERDERRAS